MARTRKNKATPAPAREREPWEHRSPVIARQYFARLGLSGPELEAKVQDFLAFDFEAAVKARQPEIRAHLAIRALKDHPDVKGSVLMRQIYEAFVKRLEYAPVGAEFLSEILFDEDSAEAVRVSKKKRMAHARSSRHVDDKAAKDLAIKLYRAGSWEDKDQAAADIRPKLATPKRKAPAFKTVRNWLKGL